MHSKRDCRSPAVPEAHVPPVPFPEVEAAERRLKGVIRPTPTARAAWLSRLCGRPLYVKPEHLQRTGSFKLRGAYNHLARLKETTGVGAVVAASAGNHAQGVALASRLLGLNATVFMPAGTALPKIEATRGYGAEVVIGLDTVDDCIDAARHFCADRGAHFVPPFDDPFVVAGQATVGVEIALEAPAATTVVVPVGGGGLAGGVALALTHLRPEIRIIGVEAAGAPAMIAALEAGAPVRLDHLDTMADGVALRSVSALTLDLARQNLASVIAVDEEEISRAVLLLLERAKWVVEPAGAIALAALLAGKIDGDDPAVAILSGGNVDPVLLMRLIEHGLTAAGRYLRVRVQLDDRPGALAALTAAVATLGLNVLGVEHHRTGPNLGPNEVEVLLSLETRDPAHREEVLPALAAAGFRASTF